MSSYEGGADLLILHELQEGEIVSAESKGVSVESKGPDGFEDQFHTEL